MFGLAMFQSLLSWISHCGGIGLPAFSRASEGFNPCCHGLAIAADDDPADHGFEVLFQSLLSWISHCGVAPDGVQTAARIVSILVVMD